MTSSKMFQVMLLFVVGTFIVPGYGQFFNATLGPRSYLNLTQREFSHQLEVVELQIASVNARFADRLNVIRSQQAEVIKYTGNATVTSQLENCYDKAAATAFRLTMYPEANVNTAKDSGFYQLELNVGGCDAVYSNNQTALQLCYTIYTDRAIIEVNYYLNLAMEQLEQSLYDSRVASRTAVKCSFEVESNGLKSQKQTLKSMNTKTQMSLSTPMLNEKILKASPKNKGSLG